MTILDWLVKALYKSLVKFYKRFWEIILLDVGYNRSKRLFLIGDSSGHLKILTNTIKIIKLYCNLFSEENWRVASQNSDQNLKKMFFSSFWSITSLLVTLAS